MEAAIMAETLNLFDELLLRARRLHAAGQWRKALDVLAQLRRFAVLPARVAEQGQALQGEILLKKRRYRAARRHLRAALGYCPDSARYHFLLGLALHADPAGDRDRAARHYRRSLELAPTQTRCRGEAGLLAIERGQTDEGLALLREAVEQAPEDPAVIARLVKGLCQAGQPDEALTTVQMARFRFRRDPRLQQLWIDLQFSAVRREQEMTALTDRERDEPTLLPFVPAADSGERGERKWRHDEAAALPGPYLVRMRSRMDRRRAP
jgi:Flp pilus assembly protein TadD